MQRFNAKLVGLLFALTVPGVVTNIFFLPSFLKTIPADQMNVMMIAATIQSLVLMALAALLGGWLAPKLGLGAPALTAWLEKRNPGSILKEQAKAGLAIGIVVATVTLVTEAFLFRPLIPADMYLLGAKEGAAELAMSILYGGIGEEVLLRWGFMSLVVWLVSFMFRKQAGGKAHPVAVWIGIVVAAVAFGAGHLPAVRAAVGSLEAGMVARTLVLNGIAALGLGYLYARKGLESAMFAHMTAHLGFFVARLIFGA